MSRMFAWTDAAWADYMFWQGRDKKKLQRINKLIADTKRSPFEGMGKPEPLKENLSGFWSRRIDETNRAGAYGHRSKRSVCASPVSVGGQCRAGPGVEQVRSDLTKEIALGNQNVLRWTTALMFAQLAAIFAALIGVYLM